MNPACHLLVALSAFAMALLSTALLSAAEPATPTAKVVNQASARK